MKSTNDELALRHGGRALGLAVRPDVLTTRFAARVAEVDPDRAVLVLKAACEILLRRMKELHHSTSLRMTGLDIGRDVGSKSRDDLSTRVDAELDIALAPDMDWWNRAQLSAAVTVLGRTLSIEARKQKPLIEVVFQQPAALVRDPERHRAEVLRRWVTRAKELAVLAQDEQAPLHVLGCDPPGDVVQTPVSVDEVRLTLDVSGRVDALRDA
ncbi:MAG: hypothetical protein U0326_43390 [Polyangiales bacterium]